MLYHHCTGQKIQIDLYRDFPLKDKKVITCEPDILSFRLKKMESEFAILASDGLWDTHSNEEAVNFIKKKLNGPSHQAILAWLTKRNVCFHPHFKGNVTRLKMKHEPVFCHLLCSQHTILLISCN